MIRGEKMGDKINYKVKRYYVNVGTEENPEWEWLNNPFNDVLIFETRWDKVKRFIKKLLHLDKRK